MMTMVLMVVISFCVEMKLTAAGGSPLLVLLSTTHGLHSSRGLMA